MGVGSLETWVGFPRQVWKHLRMRSVHRETLYTNRNVVCTLRRRDRIGRVQRGGGKEAWGRFKSIKFVHGQERGFGEKVRDCPRRMGKRKERRTAGWASCPNSQEVGQCARRVSIGMFGHETFSSQHSFMSDKRITAQACRGATISHMEEWSGRCAGEHCVAITKVQTPSVQRNPAI